VGEQLDARTAAARLGVDVRTLYAYVSRGALRRVTGPDGRSSRYDSDDLELLARRSRPRTLPRPPASIDLVIATGVSTVTDGLIRYRGTDVADLVAAREPFEAVAELLWTGRLAPPGPPPAGWVPPAGLAPSLATLLADLDDGLPVVQRFAAVVAALPADRLAVGGTATARPAWPDWGRRIIAALVQASGTAAAAAAAAAAGAAGARARAGARANSARANSARANSARANSARANSARANSVAAGSVAAGSVAAGLWQRWSPLRAAPARVRALNTALVLLAEHELATSTLAVRVAASARAAPAGCVLAGLGALSGTLHGDVPRRVREQLLDLQAGARPAGHGASPTDHGAASATDHGAASATDHGAAAPAALGFGHPVHRHGDPRAAPLLQAVHAIATPADRALIEQATRAAAAPASVDFALGALCHVARMPPQAATAVFAVARTAGWIAHAAEEWGEPALRFRGRAVVRQVTPAPRAVPGRAWRGPGST